MIIENIRIFRGNGFEEGSLCTDGERIAERAGGEELDGCGLYALPGLVDIHLHGAAGVDCSDAGEEELQRFLDDELQRGIAAVCPTAMCLPEAQLLEMMKTVGNHHNGRGADVAGIRLEGPFLNAERCGAQDRRTAVPGDSALYERLQQASGNRIRIVDTAPEIPGNLDFIRRISPEVRVSIAHTTADYDTAGKAFQAGASHVTHLYNAMNPIHHRKPGPVLAAWESGASVEVICDGIHVHPSVIRMTFALFGDDRVILVSDSMAGTGLPDGEYLLGGQSVMKQGARAVLKDHPDILAGSVTDLYTGFRKAVREMGIPLVSAVKAVTVNPARIAGIDQDYGSLETGRYADILLVNDKLEIQRIIHRGISI